MAPQNSRAISSKTSKTTKPLSEKKQKSSKFNPDKRDGYLKSTPIAQRIASFRLSHVDSSLTTQTLSNMLKSELKDAIQQNAVNLVDHVFRDECLPFAITRELLEMTLHLFNERPSGTTRNAEKDTAEWFNKIGEALAKHTRCQLLRKWSSANSSKPLKGSSIKRKPDIALYDIEERDASWEASWKDVVSICEITSQVSSHRRLEDTVLNKSFLAFVSQYNRRLIPIVTIWGQQSDSSSFKLTLSDRSGIIQSVDYKIAPPSLTFLRLLAALMFGDKTLLGFDTTMQQDSNNEITSIQCSGIKYDVVGLIFRSQTLRGRATQCWHVQKDGKKYVIKDSWCQKTRNFNEIDRLKDIREVQGVPTLIGGEDVRISPGVVDSTNLIRKGLTIYDPKSRKRSGIVIKEERLHRRIVMTPVAEPIYTFKSKKELIGAFIDVISGASNKSFLRNIGKLTIYPAHQHLCTEKKILHRDISYNNIMLYHSPDSANGLRKGLLIDFDYALPLDNSCTVSVGDRTGTGPFMALEVLKNAGGEQTQQKPRHDLESIFYVLLYICMKLKGPNNMKRTVEDNGGLPMTIDSWFSPGITFRDLRDKKIGQLFEFETRFINKFMPYFFDLRGCVSQLWNHIYPLRKQEDDVCVGTHKGMLSILQETFEALPLKEDTSDADLAEIQMHLLAQSQPHTPRNIESESSMDSEEVDNEEVDDEEVDDEEVDNEEVNNEGIFEEVDD
jgi:serine/threonine protein kinase